MIITPGIAEIIGIYLGDGYIYKKNKKYQIGFVGNPITDKELFDNLQKLILKEFGKETKIKIRERGLRLVFNSKPICNLLTESFNLPHGKGKCENVFIPEVIFENWELSRHTLRGIMDSDGTVFVSKKPRIEKYPTMEITTTSPQLAEQIKDILLSKDFRVAKIRKSLSKLSKLPAYRVPLHGKKNLKRWLDEIGFSNKYKENRAKEYLQ